MIKDNDKPSSSSSTLLKHKPYDKKKGIVFGALAGFVAAIAFSGVILFMSVFLRYPEGAFLNSLGLSIINSNNNNSVVSIGLSSFAIVLVQGILIGTIFGLIVSIIKPFNPSSQKKGVGLGLLAGIISFIVLYLPMVYWSSIYQNLLSKTLSVFSSSTFLSTRGTEAIISNQVPIESIIFWGLISYLIFGFIMGGIVTLAYSIYNYDRKEIEKEEKQQKKK
jgi:hypothetical protein